MSRIFITAACAFSLLGPAAFAQSSMGNSKSPSNSMSPASSTMAPGSMQKPADSMTKPKTDTGMSNSMAPSSSMGNSMTHPSNGMSQ